MKKIYFLAPLLSFGVIFLLTPNSALAACKTTQNQITVISRDAGGSLLPGLNFNIFQQKTNPDNQPYLGTSLTSGKTDDGGQAVVCVSKNSSPYAIKFYQYHSTYGNIMKWHGSLATVDGGYKADFKLGYLRVIFRDPLGQLLKNIAFDVYVQEYDADGKPIIGEAKLNQEKLISSLYNTGATGEARAYLGAGTYIIRAHGQVNSYYYLWNQKLYDAEAKKVGYKLSTIRIILRDELGNLLTNTKFSLGEQSTTDSGLPNIKKNLLTTITGDAGYKDVYLTPKRYALTVGAKKLYNLDVFNSQITVVDWPKFFSVRPTGEVALTNPSANAALTFAYNPTATVSGLTGFKKTASWAYTVKASAISKPYTVQFFYNAKALQQRGINPGKLRIAFYNETTKKWQLVGKNVSAQQIAVVTAKDVGTFVLVETK